MIYELSIIKENNKTSIKIYKKISKILCISFLFPCPILANFLNLPTCINTSNCTISSPVTPKNDIYMKNTTNGTTNTLTINQGGSINSAKLNANTALITNGIGSTLTITNQGTIGINSTPNNRRSVRTDGILNLTNSGIIQGRITNNGTMNIINQVNGNIQGTIENWKTITNLTQNSTNLLAYSQVNGAKVNAISIGAGSTLRTSSALSATGTITNSGTLSATGSGNINFTGTDITNNTSANITANIITNSTNANVTNEGSITNLANQKTITNFTNSGTLTNLNNNGTITTLKNSGTSVITSLTNNNIITNLTNETTATITTFNSNSVNLSTITNNGNIGTLNVQKGTLTYTGTTSNQVTGALSIKQGATLNVTSALNASGSINNAGTMIAASGSSINYTGINGITNSGNISGTFNINSSGADVTNSGTIASLTNQNTINTLTNNGTLTALTNNTTASINTFNATNGTSNITNSGTITNFNATGGTNTITNNTSGNIITFTASNANTKNTLTNNATITTLNLQNGINTINNNANGAFTNVNITGGTNTIDNKGNITNTLSFGGGTNTLNNNLSINTLENKDTSNLTLTNIGSINSFNNQATTDTFTNNGTITTLTNNKTINTFTNNNTITTLTNNNGATITTFNSNAKVASTFNNNGTIINLNVNTNTLNYEGTTNKITGTLSIKQGATLNATSTLNASGSINNFGTMSGTNGNNINFTGTDITNNTGANITANIITNSTNANVTNEGSIASLTNQNTINTLTNNGTLASLTNNNTGNIIAFENSKNITAFNNQGKIDSLNNTGNFTTFNNSGNIANFTNTGTISTFNNTGEITLNNTGLFTSGINNSGGGIISYNAQWDFANKNTDRKIIWQTSTPNQNRYNFKNDGVKSAINIGPNSVLVNIRQSNTAYNTPNNTLLNNATNGHIIVAGDNIGGIKFQDESIIVNPLFEEGFSRGKDYELNSLVLKNEAGNLSKAGMSVNSTTTKATQGGISLNALKPFQSTYTIEQGTTAGTFKIGIDPTKGPGKITTENSVNSNIMNSLALDSIFDPIFLDSKYYNEEPQMLNPINPDSAPYHTYQAKTWNVFVLPYLSSKSNKVLNIDNSLAGRTNGYAKGVIAGLTYANEETAHFGSFVSYEGSDTSFINNNNINDDLNFHNTSFLGGLRYAYPFFGKMGQLWYIKAGSNASITNSSISSNVDGKGETKIYSYSSNLGLAVDYFPNDPYKTLTFSLGMGYDGGFIKGFRLDNDINKKFNQGQLYNLFYANLGTRYKYSFTQRAGASFEVGVRKYLNDTLISKVKINGEIYEGKFKLSPYYAYVNTALNFNFTDDFEVSIAYHLLGAGKSGLNHTGYLNANYSW